ncbi:MAG: signal peptidase I [Propionibacteriales bacterium]|nr:signal peptidase I [Propionibacteriales bacterium]
MTRTVRWGREAVLWLGGAVGVLCIASFLAGWLFSVTPLVFASGSMSPAYETGALGIAHEVPAADIEVGDVVSVVNAEGNRVTHRVVQAAPAGDTVALTLQGDTNSTPDAETYYVSAADRVSFGVPFAGYALSAASSPFGLLVMVLLVLASLFLGFGRREGDAPRAIGNRVRVLVPAGLASVVALGGVVGVTGGAPWAFTSAVWTDVSTATATISTPVVDTTPPALSNPLPANAASGATWAAIDCASAVDQICVTATDTGGSGVNAVAVKLVRTNGADQCWNGTAFVPGTACPAQPMTLVAGNQYRTSGLTSAVMVQGAYQATFSATDVAGNSATPLVTTFGVIPAPVITVCNGSNGNNPFNLTWTWPTGVGAPDSFKLYYGNAQAPTTLPDVTSPYTGTSVNLNGPSGTFRIVAVIDGVESPMSNGANYTSGGGKTCAIQPT